MQELERLQGALRGAALLRWIYALFLLVALGAVAHTLPVSYLRLVPDAEYLHLELVFNPFELSFMAEVDDNKDNELDPGELAAHGQVVAERVVGALKISVGGREVRAETVGMDPDLAGHHVRLRAHYKVDARRQPLTVESDLNSLMSASHLTQVMYVNGDQAQLAQLDSQSRKVTFQPPAGRRPAAPEVAPKQRVVFKKMMVGEIILVVVGVAWLVLLRRRRT